jgi:PAS domain S-box-containing protein
MLAVVASPDGQQDQDAPSRELETGLNAISDYVIITLDADGRVRSWNDGAEAMRGFTTAEVIGQPVSIFYTPEDRQAGLADRELREAGASGRFHGEGWRVRKDGSRFWANVTVIPVRDGDGTVAGFVKATRDITEQKRAESLFAGLLESAPDAMIITTADGRIELVNRQAEQLFGYSREELTGVRWRC